MNNEDIVYIEKHLVCQSAHQDYYIGAFYIINGLLLVCGAFLAWETRKVSIPALNDSKYIGIWFYVFSIPLMSSNNEHTDNGEVVTKHSSFQNREVSQYPKIKLKKTVLS